MYEDVSDRFRVQGTISIDGGEKWRDGEFFRRNEAVSKRLGELSISKCVCAVTYKLHHQYLFQSEMVIGRSESCRAVTNCPMFV